MLILGGGNAMEFFPDKSFLELVQLFSSALIPVVALFGVIAAWQAIHANRTIQREINAMKAHLDYLKLSLEYPKLAFPRNTTEINLESQEIGGCKVQFEKYEWFVSSMLASMRLLLEASPHHSSWRKIAVLQISYHWRYIEKYRGIKEYLTLWDLELESVIDEGIAIGKRQKH